MSESVTPKQRCAIVVLLATGSPLRASEAVGVTLRTMRRWQASTPFSEALRDAARSGAGEALSQLLAAGVEAVEVLRETLRSGSPVLRVRAAQILLEAGMKAADFDLDQRVKRLEVAAWGEQTTVDHGLRLSKAS